MVARQQQTHRSRERQAAVCPVRREPFETAVRRNLLRQVVQIRERVQAQGFVADLHSSGSSRMSCNIAVSSCVSAKYFSRIPAFSGVPTISASESRSTLKSPLSLMMLSAWLTASRNSPTASLSRHLFRGQVAPAEGVERRLLPRALPCGFGDEQVAGMVQIRTFVEMTFIAAA